LLARGRAVERWREVVVDAAPPSDAEVDAALSDGGSSDDSDAMLPGASGNLDAGPAPAKAPSRVVFRVTTVSQKGRYEPKNAGAIWVEDAEGNGIKTLALWASVRIRYLKEYNTSNAKVDKVDAVTSATLKEHRTHEVTWNLRAGGQLVPDGMYTIRVEVTDDDVTGENFSVMFLKGAEPRMIRPADGPLYTGVELRYE
jgi:hypothetical protein